MDTLSVEYQKELADDKLRGMMQAVFERCKDKAVSCNSKPGNVSDPWNICLSWLWKRLGDERAEVDSARNGSIEELQHEIEDEIVMLSYIHAHLRTIDCPKYEFGPKAEVRFRRESLENYPMD